jgi:hypothetical protein
MDTNEPCNKILTSCSTCLELSITKWSLIIKIIHYLRQDVNMMSMISLSSISDSIDENLRFFLDCCEMIISTQASNAFFEFRKRQFFFFFQAQIESGKKVNFFPSLIDFCCHVCGM